MSAENVGEEAGRTLQRPPGFNGAALRERGERTRPGLRRAAGSSFNGAALRERGELVRDDDRVIFHGASTEPRCVSAENIRRLRWRQWRRAGFNGAALRERGEPVFASHPQRRPRASTEPRCVSAENDVARISAGAKRVASTEPRCVSAENCPRSSAPVGTSAASTEPRCVSAENDGPRMADEVAFEVLQRSRAA